MRILLRISVAFLALSCLAPSALAGLGDPIGGVLTGLGSKGKILCDQEVDEGGEKIPPGLGDPIQGVLVGLGKKGCAAVPDTDFGLGHVADEVCAYLAARENDTDLLVAQDCTHATTSALDLYATTTMGCSFLWQEGNGEPGLQPEGDPMVLTLADQCQLLRTTIQTNCVALFDTIIFPDTGEPIVDNGAKTNSGGIVCGGMGLVLAYAFNDPPDGTLP